MMNVVKNIFVGLLAIVFVSSNLVAMDKRRLQDSNECANRQSVRNHRAAFLIKRCRALLRKAPTHKDRTSLSQIIENAQNYILHGYSRGENSLLFVPGASESPTQWVLRQLKQHGFSDGFCDYGPLLLFGEEAFTE